MTADQDAASGALINPGDNEPSVWTEFAWSRVAPAAPGPAPRDHVLTSSNERLRAQDTPEQQPDGQQHQDNKRWTAFQDADGGVAPG